MKSTSLEDSRSIVIIGAGISGLALGAYIKDAGFNCILLEKKGRIGGNLESNSLNGQILEWGACTSPSNTAFDQLNQVLGISDKVIPVHSNANKRSILKKGKLKSVGTSPSSVASSGVFSFKGRQRFMAERYKKPNLSEEDESIGSFVERRFGQEAVDYVANPWAAHFGGDPYELGMRTNFPQLLDWEARHSSISKAFKKEDALTSDTVGYIGGMTTLVNALENYIGQEDILLNTEVTKVSRPNVKYEIQLEQDGQHMQIEADVVVFATPAFVTAQLIQSINSDIAGLLAQVVYPNTAVAHLLFDKKTIKRKTDNYGLMVPANQDQHFLSATYNSSLFPDQYDSSMTAISLLLGGRRQGHLLEHQEIDRLVDKAVDELSAILKISAAPLAKEFRVRDKAIPQFGLNHFEVVNGLNLFEKNMSNIHFIGSYRNGLSVADCIRGAKQAHGRLIKDYSFQSYYSNKY